MRPIQFGRMAPSQALTIGSSLAQGLQQGLMNAAKMRIQRQQMEYMNQYRMQQVETNRLFREQQLELSKQRAAMAEPADFSLAMKGLKVYQSGGDPGSIMGAMNPQTRQLFGSMLGSQTKKDVAGTQAESRENVAGIQAGAKENVANIQAGAKDLESLHRDRNAIVKAMGSSWDPQFKADMQKRVDLIDNQIIGMHSGGKSQQPAPSPTPQPTQPATPAPTPIPAFQQGMKLEKGMTLNHPVHGIINITDVNPDNPAQVKFKKISSPAPSTPTESLPPAGEQ